jgi:hypothetical protein
MIIDKIEISPPVVQVVWGTDLHSELEAAASVIAPSADGASKFFVLGAEEERSLPLTYQLAGVPDAQIIKIRLGWRNTRRPLPFTRTVFIRTAARDLRLLQEEARSKF